MREPLFILAPPRSYTSVVGGILGQHPEAYGLPEVNLSKGDTLGDLWDSVPISVNFSTSGLLRLLAELHEGNQSEDAVLRARKWVLQRPHWTPKQVFDHIQDCVGPDRMLVEKSPHNTFTAQNLRRLVRCFPRANFLHLTRHPKTHGKSMLDLMRSYGEDRDIIDPERNWYRSHKNIIELAESLPTAQYMQIRGETLLRAPLVYLPQICEWLDIDSGKDAIDAMMHPETSPYAMPGPPSAPFGNDPNYLLEPVLDFDRLARISEPELDGAVAWKKDGGTLARGTFRMARRFGYA